MSVYTTKEITRNEAIEQLNKVWKQPCQMTNLELEREMFNHFGSELAENTRLENYLINE